MSRSSVDRGDHRSPISCTASYAVPFRLAHSSSSSVTARWNSSSPADWGRNTHASSWPA